MWNTSGVIEAYACTVLQVRCKTSWACVRTRAVTNDWRRDNRSNEHISIALIISCWRSWKVLICSLQSELNLRIPGSSVNAMWRHPGCNIGENQIMRSIAHQQRCKREASLHATIAKTQKSIRTNNTVRNSTKCKRDMENGGTRWSGKDRDSNKDRCKAGALVYQVRP